MLDSDPFEEGGREKETEREKERIREWPSYKVHRQQTAAMKNSRANSGQEDKGHGYRDQKSQKIFQVTTGFQGPFCKTNTSTK